MKRYILAILGGYCFFQALEKIDLCFHKSAGRLNVTQFSVPSKSRGKSREIKVLPVVLLLHRGGRIAQLIFL